MREAVLGVCELAAADRGISRALAGPRFAAVRKRLMPSTRRIVERAQNSGRMRPEFSSTDFGVLLWLGDALHEYAGHVDGRLWRRYVEALLDGLLSQDEPRRPLKTLRWATRTARLWEGYDLGLDSIAIDMMHSSLDTIVAVLGRPRSVTAVGTSKDTGGSAAEVLLAYPQALAQCSASSLMPAPYGVQGNWRAVFAAGVLESAWTAGYDGRARTELTEYTDQGSRGIELPDNDAYATVIDHVVACREGKATSRATPASVLDALQLTLDVNHALTAEPSTAS